MDNGTLLTSIVADVSGIEEKLSELLKMLPEHVVDEFIGKLFGLVGNVIIADSSATVGAGGAVNIVLALDFDAAAYNQILSAARALNI